MPRYYYCASVSSCFIIPLRRLPARWFMDGLCAPSERIILGPQAIPVSDPHAHNYTTYNIYRTVARRIPQESGDGLGYDEISL